MNRVADALEYGIVGINTGSSRPRSRVRWCKGVGDRTRGLLLRDRRVARAEVVGDRRDQRAVIVVRREYNVHTCELPEPIRVDEEGIAIVR